jgi:hypothetical protein
LGIITDDKLLNWNAYAPIDITDVGIEIVVIGQP